MALAALFALNPLPAAALSAPWYGAETYYLKLLNCSRTGGWVRSDGTCWGYGSGRYGGYVRPLLLSASISNAVTRPYAWYLATTNQCTHYGKGTTIKSRLASRGFAGSAYGENLGCAWGVTNAYRAVLSHHRFFQAEYSYNGPHWKNIKNSRYKYVGIGVWVSYARERLVVDFFAW